MVDHKIPWFYQDFKSKILCFLNLYSVHAVRILELSLEIMLNSSKWVTKHLDKSKIFSFMPELVKYFDFLDVNFINVFKMC